MEAGRCGSNELVDVLLKVYNASMCIQNKQGYNVLHTSAESGSSKVIINLVRNYKMDLNCLTGNGTLSALQIAQKVNCFTIFGWKSLSLRNIVTLF